MLTIGQAYNSRKKMKDRLLKYKTKRIGHFTRSQYPYAIYSIDIATPDKLK